jgi:hypothetical protein
MEFKTPKGTVLPLLDIKGKPYLKVQDRLIWFREERPDWSIETVITLHGTNAAMARAQIKDSSGRVIATAHKFEDVKGFPDFIEKSESGSIGRALAMCGFGTQFALSEFDEGTRIVDSPSGTWPQAATQSQSSTRPNHPAIIPPPRSPAANPRDVATFGKFAKYKTVGGAMEACGLPELQNYCNWLLTQNKESEMRPVTKTFFDAVKQLTTGPVLPPPKFDDPPLNLEQEMQVEAMINEQRGERRNFADEKDEWTRANDNTPF